MRKIPLYFRFLLLVLAFLTANCGILSRRGEKHLSPEEMSFQEYKIAKLSEETDRNSACSSYLRLAELNDFPLKKIATLKAHIFCPQILTPLEISMFEKDKWLSGLLTDAIQYDAVKKGDPQLMIDFLRNRAQQAERNKDRIDLLQRALSIARRMNSPIVNALEEELFRISPKISQAQIDRFRLGLDFIASRDFKKGRSYLKLALKERRYSLEEQHHIRIQYRNSFKLEQNKEDYIKESERHTNWTLKTRRFDWQLDSYLNWARAVWTEGQASLATEILSKAEKHLKKKVNLAELYFVLARIEEESERLPEAYNYLENALNEKGSKNSLKNKILFAKAWNLRKQKRFEDAVQTFIAMKDFAQLEGTEIQRVRFWMAKSLAQSGKLAEAEKEFRALTQDDSVGYYGLISYRELSESIPPVNAKSPKKSSERNPAGQSPSEQALSALPDKLLVKSLVLVEEKDLLSNYLGDQIASMKQNGTATEDLLFYLRSFAEAGLFSPLFGQLNILPSSIRAQLVQEYPELLFPRRFSEIIQPQSDKWLVSPSLVFSIIRQESSFNPKARSPADAFGLMQVLPQVAEKYSSSAGVNYTAYDDLYSPHINIPIGISLLADLNKKYQGQIVLIAAAYNAGEKPLENWLKMRFREDTVEFIEDIPYEETRTYVKLILRNYIYYQRLEKPSETIAFPKNCIDSLSTFQVSRAN